MSFTAPPAHPDLTRPGVSDTKPSKVMSSIVFVFAVVTARNPSQRVCAVFCVYQKRLIVKLQALHMASPFVRVLTT
jgi:hypothetical protein